MNISLNINPRYRKNPVESHILFFWMFIFVELMFFTGLISGFLVTRLKTNTWPQFFDSSNSSLWLTFINTSFLFLSALTMYKASSFFKQDFHQFKDPRSLKKLWGYLFITFVLGFLFLFLQGIEWIQVFKKGLTLENLGIYASFFYTLLMAHAFHVLLGFLFLLYFLTLFSYLIFFKDQDLDNKKISYLKKLSQLSFLYWYFVVLLWPIIYFLTYWA